MMRTLPHMGLIMWDQLEDPYDHIQLANNFAKVDAHDHTPGRGTQLTTQSIEGEAVTTALLAAESVTAAKLGSGAIKYEEGTVGSRPGAGKKGREYFQTDSGQEGFSQDTGSAWRSIFSLSTTSTYASEVARTAGTEYEVSASRPSIVLLTLTGELSKSLQANYSINGTSIGAAIIPVGSSVAPVLFATLPIPPGQKWKFTGTNVEFARSRYLIL